jgi:type VI secretion system protein ImpK
MNKESHVSWQKLPTVVELTQEGERKNREAQEVADLLDTSFENRGEADVPEQEGGWSVENLLQNFRFDGDGMPTLVAASAGLLNLAHELRLRDDKPDIELLRRATINSVARYERDLAAARISPERARAAHYIVCATVDDVVLSKPWGVRSGWAQSGLVSTFHMDVTGGDRVFDLLDHFHQSSGANKDLLLLIYLCLSLAFEGRTRVSPRGGLELSRIRDSLYKTLLGQYGIVERELSPHWRGVSARHQPMRTSLALWSQLAVMILLFALSYLLFTFSLNEASDGTFKRLAGLPPHGTASIFVPPPEPQPALVTPAAEEPVVTPHPPEAKPASPPEPKPIDNLLAFLQPEVERNLIKLFNSDGRLLIRINNSGLFDAGSAEVDEDFKDLIQRIGGALASENFRALVVGYTDDRPIRTIEFPSNWHLSEARARAVGDILAAYTGPNAILTQGRAESNPVAGNDTPEGREANRRTEILVLTDAGPDLEAAGIAPAGYSTSSGADDTGDPNP